MTRHQILPNRWQIQHHRLLILSRLNKYRWCPCRHSETPRGCFIGWLFDSFIGWRYLYGMQLKSPSSQCRATEWCLSWTCIEDNHNVWKAANNKELQNYHTQYHQYYDIWLYIFINIINTHTGSNWDNPGTPSLPSSILITMKPGTHDEPVLWNRTRSWEHKPCHFNRKQKTICFICVTFT